MDTQYFYICILHRLLKRKCDSIGQPYYDFVFIGYGLTLCLELQHTVWEQYINAPYFLNKCKARQGT